MVKLFKLIVGTAVILADWSAGIMTSSPVVGTPLGLQLLAVVHIPPDVGTHVLVAALAKATINTISAVSNSALNERSKCDFILLRFLEFLRLGFRK